jgi:hypothetical protein
MLVFASSVFAVRLSAAWRWLFRCASQRRRYMLGCFSIIIIPAIPGFHKFWFRQTAKSV